MKKKDETRIFKVTYNGRSYPVIGTGKQTAEQIWNSVKSFYFAGAHVTITDDNGNATEFVRE